MRSTSRRRAGAVLALGVLLTSMAACGGDDGDDGPAAGGTTAEQQEALVVYVGRDEELVSPLLARFTEETGVEIEARYAGTGDHLALLMEEGEQTPADVFLSQDAGALGTLAAAGRLQQVDPEVSAGVLEDFTSTDGTWVGVTGRARVIAYDSTRLEESEVPTTVAQLAEDEWKGRVGLPPGNASFQAFVTGFRAAAGDEAARSWLTAMVDNDVQTFEGNGDVLEALETGVVELGLINHYYVFERAAELGADQVSTRLVFPEAGDPGALVNVTGAGVLSSHPDAEKLVSYLVSEAGQRYFVENTFEYPVVEGVDAPDGLPALSDIEGPIEDLAELEDLEATVTMLDEVGLS